MGFDYHICVLRQVEDFYILKAVDTIAFPSTHQTIKINAIEKLIFVLEKAKVKNLASRLQSNALFTLI